MPLIDGSPTLLAQRMKACREQIGWSQVALARRTGLETTLIWRIESGTTSNPRIESVKAIARALQVSLDWLTGMYDDTPVGAGT